MYSVRVIAISALFVFMHTSANAAQDPSEKTDIIAFVQDSAPKYLSGADNKMGLCGDIYALLAKRLSARNISITISSHYTPIKRILQSLETQSTGIYCGASRNKKREEKFTYSSEPLYHVSNILVTHAGNVSEPASIEDLMTAEATVGTYFGTGSSVFLKKTGLARIYERYSSVEQGMRDVAAGEIDYFFYHDLGLLYTLSNSSLPLRAVSTKFRSYPHWMIFSKSMRPKLQRVISHELSEMVKNGVVERLWKKYKPKVL